MVGHIPHICWIILSTDFKHSALYHIWGIARLYMFSEASLRCLPHTGKKRFVLKSVLQNSLEHCIYKYYWPCSHYGLDLGL